MGHYKTAHLTDVQERILHCIRRAIVEDGEAPAVREIAVEVGRSVGAVHYQLGELEAKSAIAREHGRARGIRLT